MIVFHLEFSTYLGCGIYLGYCADHVDFTEYKFIESELQLQTRGLP